MYQINCHSTCTNVRGDSLISLNVKMIDRKKKMYITTQVAKNFEFTWIRPIITFSVKLSDGSLIANKDIWIATTCKQQEKFQIYLPKPVKDAKAVDLVSCFAGAFCTIIQT